MVWERIGGDDQERLSRISKKLSKDNEYTVSIEHLVCSILLGIVSYDADLLVVFNVFCFFSDFYCF